MIMIRYPILINNTSLWGTALHRRRVVNHSFALLNTFKLVVTSLYPPLWTYLSSPCRQHILLKLCALLLGARMGDCRNGIRFLWELQYASFSFFRARSFYLSLSHTHNTTHTHIYTHRIYTLTHSLSLRGKDTCLHPVKCQNPTHTFELYDGVSNNQ